jgi:hypothetical protein
LWNGIGMADLVFRGRYVLGCGRVGHAVGPSTRGEVW